MDRHQVGTVPSPPPRSIPVEGGARAAWKADEEAPSPGVRDDEVEASSGAGGSPGCSRWFPALAGVRAGVAGNGSTVAGGSPAAAGVLRFRTGRSCTCDGSRRSGGGRDGGGDSGSAHARPPEAEKDQADQSGRPTMRALVDSKSVAANLLARTELTMVNPQGLAATL
eukprot:3404531-Pleurochrysis_carterae.AAC.1